MRKPTLIVHTTYLFSSDKLPGGEEDQQRARDFGAELYELLTRPLSEPLAWGAGIPVRAATPPEEIDGSEAEHVVVIPILGQRSAHADWSWRERRAFRSAATR
jgi:hypothetical protein